MNKNKSLPNVILDKITYYLTKLNLNDMTYDASKSCYFPLKYEYNNYKIQRRKYEYKLLCSNA